MNRTAKTKGATRAVPVNVKLTPRADREQFVNTLSGAPGIRRVVQTFPGETNQDLAALFLVEVEPSSLDSALRQLRKNSDVEYAEEAAPRKLIR